MENNDLTYLSDLIGEVWSKCFDETINLQILQDKTIKNKIYRLKAELENFTGIPTVGYRRLRDNITAIVGNDRGNFPSDKTVEVLCWYHYGLPPLPKQDLRKWEEEGYRERKLWNQFCEEIKLKSFENTNSEVGEKETDNNKSTIGRIRRSAKIVVAVAILALVSILIWWISAGEIGVESFSTEDDRHVKILFLPLDIVSDPGSGRFVKYLDLIKARLDENIAKDSLPIKYVFLQKKPLNSPNKQKLMDLGLTKNADIIVWCRSDEISQKIELNYSTVRKLPFFCPFKLESSSGYSELKDPSILRTGHLQKDFEDLYYWMIGMKSFKKNDFELTSKCFSKTILDTLFNLNILDVVKCDSIGEILMTMNEPRRALKFFQKSLELQQGVLRKDSSVLAHTYDNIALCLSYYGKYEEAFNNYYEALSIGEAYFSSTDPDLATIYNDIGTTFNDTEKYDSAVHYLQKAILIRSSQNNSNEDWKLANNFTNLSLSYNGLKRIDEAIKANRTAADILEQINLAGQFSLKLAAVYNNLAGAHYFISNLDSSLYYFKRALSISIATNGVKHSDTGLYYNNIGAVFSKMQNYDSALVNLEKAMNIREEIHDEITEERAQTYNNLGEVLMELDRCSEAVEFNRKAIYIRESLRKNKVFAKSKLELSYRGFSHTFECLMNYDSAMIYLGKSLILQKEATPIDSNLLEDSNLRMADLSKKITEN